jgi:hypothetical protein
MKVQLEETICLEHFVTILDLLEVSSVGQSRHISYYQARIKTFH